MPSNRTVQVQNEKLSKHEKKGDTKKKAASETTAAAVDTTTTKEKHHRHHRTKEEKRAHKKDKKAKKASVTTTKSSAPPHAEMKKAKHHTSTWRAKAEVSSKAVRHEEVVVAKVQRSTRLYLKDGPLTKLIRMFSDRIAVERLATAAVLDGSLDEDDVNEAQFEKVKIKKNRLKIARAAIDNLKEALQHAIHQFFANGVIVKDKVSFRQRRVLGMVDCLAALECDSNLKAPYHDFITRCNAQFDEFLARRLVERNLAPVTKAIASAEKQLSEDKNFEYQRKALPVPLALPEPEFVGDDLLPRILAAPPQLEEESAPIATPTAPAVEKKKDSSKKRKRSEEQQQEAPAPALAPITTPAAAVDESSSKKKEKKAKHHHSTRSSSKKADEEEQPQSAVPAAEQQQEKPQEQQEEDSEGNTSTSDVESK